MILMFTDFGPAGPYLGEMEAELARHAPEVPRIRLLADAPAFAPRPAAYLLAALAARFAPGDVCLAVVDPGVGGDRLPLAVEADGRWFVGPDNGLFELLLRRAERRRSFVITWRPPQLSASFHGRDLFAPVAARLARGERRGLEPATPTRFPDWPEDWPAIVYIDAYGNAMTGLRASAVAAGTVLRLGEREIGPARTFAAVAEGAAFWYVNSAGLVEIAVHRGHAATEFGLTIGSPVGLADPGG